MILDKENLYSDDQALTTTADSTNVLDLGVANRGPGNPMLILIQVTTTFAGGTNVTIDLETDDNTSFSSLSTIGSTQTIVTATLVQGYNFTIQFVPDAMERYSRLEYTISGTYTAGNVTAGIIFERQTSKGTFPVATI